MRLDLPAETGTACEVSPQAVHSTNSDPVHRDSESPLAAGAAYFGLPPLS